MPVNTWVKVKWRTRRNVYVNANYEEAAGLTNTPMRIETGQNTFELLTPERDIEVSLTVKNVPSASKSDPFLVDLAAEAEPDP